MNIVISRHLKIVSFSLLVALLWRLTLSGLTAAEVDLKPLSAQWIWLPAHGPSPYNQTVIARKTFKATGLREATLRITADTCYRLLVNGRWINDGPCRSWPEHYKFDVIDLRPFLRDGQNELLVYARYFGVGDFHHIPQAAGLLAQLDAVDQGGRAWTLITDRSWEVAAAPEWKSETPKISIQMGPAEWYDARLEHKNFVRAAVVCKAEAGPWKDLRARDVALLTKQPRPFRSFLGAKVVQAEGWNFCLPAVRLSSPGVIEANRTAGAACGMATLVENEQPVKVELRLEGMQVAVDGRQMKNNRFDLPAGRHLLVAFSRELFGHDKEKALRFVAPANYKLVNPLQGSYENPFVLVRLPEFAIATNDLLWSSFDRDDPKLSRLIAGYQQTTGKIFATATNVASLQRLAGAGLELLPSEKMFVADAFWQFTDRTVVGDGTALVQNPAGLIYDNAEATTVLPSANGDVELLYDLGEQDVGYYDFAMTAEAGVVVDICGIEYISPDGRLQHTRGNRNGMRYITKAGVNHFTSLNRRSGRYLFVTLRQQTKPVQIQRLQLVSSTYPVNEAGSFECSDARLNQIWGISTRTLKLCMEDTFTDCPLYEQTHWVGDARNESLLAYGVFGGYDLAARCARLTADSLEHLPIAGCQTPSSWDTLLPAWSFLWGISTWDYYFETGDRRFLEDIYPAVIRNLKGAEQFTDKLGLFSGPFWNMFDWSGSDQDHRTVVHNSMFVVGAIDAAIKEAKVLGRGGDIVWLEKCRTHLVQAVNALWDDTRKAYPDSVHEDGKLSDSISQHTSILGLLYDIVPPDKQAAALQNLIHPPEKMVRLGSPFAAFYLYEAYEKLGLQAEIVKDIYRNYAPMLEAGATTVWESYPQGTTGRDQWPTRSHCHAWSAAPTRFLDRIVLGVKADEPGGNAIEISPHLSGLDWAKGKTLTRHGLVVVSWRKEGNRLLLNFKAPKESSATFVKNPSLEGLEILVNGKPLSE